MEGAKMRTVNQYFQIIPHFKNQASKWPQVTEASRKYVTIKQSFVKVQDCVGNWKKLYGYKKEQ